MRRHASGTGCGARGRGMNAPPKLPGGAGLRPGTLVSPARSWLTAKPLDLPEARKLGPPKRGRGYERRQGETGCREARPGAVGTLRWSAERRGRVVTGARAARREDERMLRSALRPLDL